MPSRRTITSQEETQLARMIRLEVLAEEAKTSQSEMKTLMTERFAKMEAQFEAMTNQFVTRQEFQPVRQIVYGFVTLTLVAVVGAILALVIKTSR